jgi:predicted regulator of Ras-like GTPase activity (Roadblock/LC7/MglB family)
MKEILEQLAEHAGVRMAALVMEDGVPVVVRGRKPVAGQTDASAAPPAQDADALAALSAGWVLEVCNAVAPLAWDKPQRMALRGTQGTLVLRRAHTAWLLVLLAGGLRSEDVLLAMDGTAARLERYVRGLTAEAEASRGNPPPAPLPKKQEPTNKGGARVPPKKNAEQESPKGR